MSKRSAIATRASASWAITGGIHIGSIPNIIRIKDIVEDGDKHKREQAANEQG
jgi:hypothetical protein